MTRLGDGDLLRMAARASLLQATWNYERQQGIGWAHALDPALRRLIPDAVAHRERLAAHTAYFNTQPTFASLALGASGTAATSATAVGVGLGGTATGAAAVAAEAAPVVAAFGVGVAAGTYINNHTKISDTAASAGTWVEQHTGGSVIAGATAAAATSIVTAPYYAGVATVDALGSAGSWLGDKVYDLVNANKK